MISTPRSSSRLLVMSSRVTKRLVIHDPADDLPDVKPCQSDDSKLLLYPTYVIIALVYSCINIVITCYQSYVNTCLQLMLKTMIIILEMH